MRALRRTLLGLQDAELFRWLLRWLKKEQQSEPAVYEELMRPQSMRKKMEDQNAGRYASPFLRKSCPAGATKRATKSSPK